MRTSALIAGVAILLLSFVAVGIWSAVLSHDTRGVLTVSFLDVGQGDAIFISAPSGRTVLIDGGPDAGVLRQLGDVMSWYDHSIDVVMPTHPDTDHISGLVDVLERYHVSYVVQSSVEGSAPIWHALESTITSNAKSGTRVITALRGQIIDLGGSTGSPQVAHAYLEILSPDRSMPHVDTNDGCVVTRLVYGKTAFMLPCDAPQAVENYLVYEDGANLHSDVLKAGHHGSNTASSPLFVGFVSPQYAIYSRGCNNKYGFPHAETIATFARLHIATLDTCKQGTIRFKSNGQTVTLDK